jgi:hypothetical protein
MSKNEKRPESPIDRYEYAFHSQDGHAALLHRVIQEIEVLKAMLKEAGVWDQKRYKAAMMERMLDDHNSAGAAPWHHHSYYPYTLAEDGFLKHRFNSSEEEITAFKKQVDEVSCLT